MSVERDALAQSICERLRSPRRTLDELNVIDDVLARLEIGADEYGALDLKLDRRDFDSEAEEECMDLLAYLAMVKIAAGHRRRRTS